MALSEEDKQEILQLLREEKTQKQELILSSKESFKRWLSSVASKLVEKLVDVTIDALWHYFLGCFGLF